MPEKRICSGCAKEFWWPGAQWQHEGCGVAVRPAVEVSGAINSAAINKDAINKTELRGRSGNRRLRDDYNAYMREYMRKSRAEKKARVSP